MEKQLFVIKYNEESKKYVVDFKETSILDILNSVAVLAKSAKKEAEKTENEKLVTELLALAAQGKCFVLEEDGSLDISDGED